MELKEFIKATISSIVEATSELQSEFEAEGILINPPSAQSGNDVYQPGSKNYTFRRVKDIEFDVAVTTSDETAKSAKAGIKVFSVGIGGEGKISKGAENVSRVRFSIPLTLKPSKEEIKNLEKKSEHDAKSLTIPRAKRM